MKNKKAFTLAEVLIVFIIIGIIATVTISTVKPWEKAYKYSYTRIFNSLSVAVYNYMTTNSKINKFPETPSEFCIALTEYINSTSKNCSPSYFLDDAPTLSKFKSGGKTPEIKLTNGAYIWIGADTDSDGKSVPFTYVEPDTADTVEYYIVYADLNGSRGPNKIKYDETSSTSSLPDIVAYIVTDKYMVIPLGRPKTDRRYLSARIMYPVLDLDDKDNKEIENPSDEMTYYEAIVGAYGKSPDKIVTIGNHQTYDIESDLPNGNKFKYVTDLDSNYTTAPTFNKVLCGNDKTAAQIKSENGDSQCSVKVFEYN
ncbi:prepilin-type N-terminal cleavage/methylation domain-containing protein [bacterium]|nr:prepilin-type N-terminal cleavage/methylation domain-containing protein [bacterium]